MKNTLYGIGLDIGVASVGWAVVGLNGTGEPVGLHRLGVRIFDLSLIHISEPTRH